MRSALFVSRFALQVVVLLATITCFSQPKTSIGLSLTGEDASSSNFVVGFGGTFETQFGKHHGIETGLFYRTFDQYIRVFVDGRLFASATIKEEFLTVPVLYKFHSALLNVSFGPTMNLYTGWRRGKGDLLFEHNDFPPDKFQIGLMAKVSKTISLTKKLFIEPGARYNSISYKHRSYYGVGVALKYALVK